MSRQVEQLSPMKQRRSQPSRRLLAAAAAERDGIERQRKKLLAYRQTLHAQIEELDAQLAELAQRVLLIERLSGVNAHSEVHATSSAQPPADEDRKVLRGPAIRQTAVKLLLDDPRHPQSLHYRDWFALLDQGGYAVAGKDPLAVFLTQLSRSPVVRRGTQSGVYELNLDAVARLRHQLNERQRQLQTLTSASASATDLSGIRSQRTALTQEIDKLEKALEEAELNLAGDPSNLAAAS
jgi:chromosome segregation ATPase